MTIAEQLRALVTAMADVQRTASFDTQCRVAEAATILVREAGRLERTALATPVTESIVVADDLCGAAR